MKELKYKEQVAYASAFVAFVLPKIDINEIILFGSVAREEASKESDIDLFFNVKTKEDETKKIINEELKKFYKSKIAEVLDPKNFIGFAPIQTEEFLENEVKPILDKYSELIGLKADLKV